MVGTLEAAGDSAENPGCGRGSGSARQTSTEPTNAEIVAFSMAFICGGSTMAKQADLKKHFEAILGEEIPEDSSDEVLLRADVAAYHIPSLHLLVSSASLHQERSGRPVRPRRLADARPFLTYPGQDLQMELGHLNFFLVIFFAKWEGGFSQAR